MAGLGQDPAPSPQRFGQIRGNTVEITEGTILDQNIRGVAQPDANAGGIVEKAVCDDDVF
jgi:hypothetical protein